MMLKNFRTVLSVIVLLTSFETLAQEYYESALLFSRTKVGGSARVQALGGSQIALGGDYSSGGSNPAGLGMFNRSEFTFSSGLTSNTTSSLYPSNYGNTTSSSDNRTVFNIPGVSLVFHIPQEKDKFLGGSFSISLSRVNDFNKSLLLRGSNTNNTIVDYFADQAFGSTTTQFDEGGPHYNSPTGLAYYNYLIGPWSSHPTEPGANDEYFTYSGYADQQEETKLKGATNQWNFSYGGNVADKFFFGAGFGVSALRYKSERMFQEQYDNPDVISLMKLDEKLDIRGSGVNATLGAIGRPVDFIQIGISYTTPTFYNITETYEAAMGTRWSDYVYYLPPEEVGGPDESVLLGDNTSDPIRTDLVTSEYNLQTPSKFSTGIAFLSKFGFITGDIELTNPGNAKYSSETFGISYSEENDQIKSVYKSTVNYRFGAEYRYDIFRVRAGYGVQSNPYKGGLDAENTIITYSGGVGVRLKTFYIDFALVNNRTKKYFYQPYTFFDGSGPVADLRTKITTGMITVGFTF